jgi:hypothetical protein
MILAPIDAKEMPQFVVVRWHRHGAGRQAGTGSDSGPRPEGVMRNRPAITLR